MLNSQIQYPGYEINMSYGQATRFLGYSLPGHILIYDQENCFLGNCKRMRLVQRYRLLFYQVYKFI